jgi:hypothetical protein
MINFVLTVQTAMSVNAINALKHSLLMVRLLVNNAIIVAILVLESRILNALIVLSAFRLINQVECAYPTVLTPNAEHVEVN